MAIVIIIIIIITISRSSNAAAIDMDIITTTSAITTMILTNHCHNHHMPLARLQMCNPCPYGCMPPHTPRTSTQG